MTPDKPAGEMPDVLYAQRSERFGYIASPHKTEPDDVRYIRADKADAGSARTMQKVEICPGVEVFMTQEQIVKWKADAAAAREALRDFPPFDSHEIVFWRWFNRHADTIKRILQREAGQ